MVRRPRFPFMSTLYGKEPPTVWMRAIRSHTYDGKPVAEGDPYLVHESYVETVESCGLGRREPAPPTATRTVPKP